jgi:hypothetical protein
MSRRAAGWLLESAGDELGAVDRWIGETEESPADGTFSQTRTATYGESVRAAIESARRHAPSGVVLATSPAETERQRRARSELDAVLRHGFVPAPWFRFVDLGVDLQLVERSLRVDGWNYGGSATALVARYLAAALVAMIEASPPSPS